MNVELILAKMRENVALRYGFLAFSANLSPAFHAKTPAMFGWWPISEVRRLARFFFDTGYKMAIRGSATPMKMGDGDQAAAKPGFSSEGNAYQKPKTQRIWPTIFLKIGGFIPRTLKNGDASPHPPCGGAPDGYILVQDPMLKVLGRNTRSGDRKLSWDIFNTLFAKGHRSC